VVVTVSGDFVSTAVVRSTVGEAATVVVSEADDCLKESPVISLKSEYSSAYADISSSSAA
jgi:hypothetical protein